MFDAKEHPKTSPPTQPNSTQSPRCHWSRPPSPLPPTNTTKTPTPPSRCLSLPMTYPSYILHLTSYLSSYWKNYLQWPQVIPTTHKGRRKLNHIEEMTLKVWRVETLGILWPRKLVGIACSCILPMTFEQICIISNQNISTCMIWKTRFLSPKKGCFSLQIAIGFLMACGLNGISIRIWK